MPEEDHRRPRGATQREEHAEVRVRGDEDTILTLGPLEEQGVRRALQVTITDVNGVVARLSQPVRDGGGQRVVDQEPHSARRSGNSRSRTASEA